MMVVPWSTFTHPGNDVGPYANCLPPFAVLNQFNNQTQVDMVQPLHAVSPYLSRQRQLALRQPGRTVPADRRTDKVRTTGKKTMKTQSREEVFSAKDWKVVKVKQPRVYTQEEKKKRKEVRKCRACLRCQYLRRTVSHSLWHT
jgi:hypothetical protein